MRLLQEDIQNMAATERRTSYGMDEGHCERRVGSPEMHFVSDLFPRSPVDIANRRCGSMALTIKMPPTCRNPHGPWSSPSATPALAASARISPGPRWSHLCDQQVSSWMAHISCRTSSPKSKRRCATMPQTPRWSSPPAAPALRRAMSHLKPPAPSATASSTASPSACAPPERAAPRSPRSAAPSPAPAAAPSS